MKIMRKMINVFLHINVVCSLVLLTVQVLDWYNPYMDFMGHTSWVIYILCGSTILLATLVAFQPTKQIPAKALKNWR